MYCPLLVVFNVNLGELAISSGFLSTDSEGDHGTAEIFFEITVF